MFGLGILTGIVYMAVGVVCAVIEWSCDLDPWTSPYFLVWVFLWPLVLLCYVVGWVINAVRGKRGWARRKKKEPPREKLVVR